MEGLVKAYTLEELKALREEIDNCPQSWSTMIIFDGIEYHTDWGYAMEGIDYFLEILERREKGCFGQLRGKGGSWTRS